MKSTARRILVLILTLLLSVLIASAKDKEKGKQSNKEHKNANMHATVDVFQVEQRNLIRNHYSVSRGSLPPGLAKRNGDLPPGLERQLIRNGHLPPGLEKKLYPFPVELDRRLPPLRPGLVRGFIAGNAVILDNRTKVILDIFVVR